ncbi:hypothetical protein E1757_14405 [Paenibacillus piri]|uniref:Uncharacterized protein n=1 Tax=Paenibacillus piri TaxID=2547395 RepID=A0A4R5KNK8_9BACL|nr:hypothetical protein E1757_14405 [Paenibacillus piri]
MKKILLLRWFLVKINLVFDPNSVGGSQVTATYKGRTKLKKTSVIVSSLHDLRRTISISPSSPTINHIPLRFISETIGAKVGWDAENYVALIVTKR